MRFGKLALALFAVLSSATFSVSRVAAATAADAQAGIRQSFNSMALGYSKHNVGQATHYLTRDFVSIDASGKSEALGDIRGELPGLFHGEISRQRWGEITSISIFSNGAEALITAHDEVNRKDHKTKKVTTIVRVTSLRTFWVRHGHAWYEKRSRVMSTTVLINGMPA